MPADTISKALTSIGAHHSGVPIEDLTVTGDAINEPFFESIIRQAKAKFPNDPEAVLDNVALGCFRCGMLYERVRGTDAR